ncbi:MAG: hypothetical protein K5790_02340 [Nitrosopumilus sp.]|uniref:hypothetical protein n=1 Tax=Nitrosopumilus sp. TaxID=2024843 RepID=UPI00247C5C45|nr:hypothetical protein [Nitrosopumilus sp.]MCV0392114.1 hypothetical protein [Nitrosopumilus sp.]
MSEKTLPSDNSDSNLPGRAEESNFGYYDVPVKSKSKTLGIAAVAFVLVSAGFFSYYFMNQNQIDSEILDNTLPLTAEQKMVSQYGVGEFGSDHAHAAIAVFVDGVQLNFGLPDFQLQSKYIHFENHNPYLIHKHATGVPLDMLFSSIGLDLTSECIGLSYLASELLCADSEKSMTFLINGKYYSEISSYEIKHNDRILISFGDSEEISEQLQYLESLKIHDIPNQYKLDPEKDILV